MAAPTPPPAEVAITPDLVRALLAAQHPDLAERDLADPLEGFDMAVLRLGDDLAVRLPRHRASTGSLEAEIRWLGLLSDRWTFPVQRTVRVGEPGAGNPWRWAITDWLPGQLAADRPLNTSEAPALGRALGEVHRPAPADAPFNSEQSIPLAERDAVLASVLPQLPAVAAHRGVTFDPDAALALWQRARSVPDDAARVWIHADLHPFNVISLEGRFAGSSTGPTSRAETPPWTSATSSSCSPRPRCRPRTAPTAGSTRRPPRAQPGSASSRPPAWRLSRDRWWPTSGGGPWPSSASPAGPDDVAARRRWRRRHRPRRAPSLRP